MGQQKTKAKDEDKKKVKSQVLKQKSKDDYIDIVDMVLWVDVVRLIS